MKNIIFDFDGVILDSLKVREFGFREIFKSFPNEQVEKLITYHTQNGGWSRFVKIKYFFNEILKKDITQDEIETYAKNYSTIMKENLTNTNNLIEETVEFIKNNSTLFNMHIASGSEQNELRYLNQELGISNYFHSIHGSPTPKIELVKDIVLQNNYLPQETLLIGDSINDYEAAYENNISFFGYNNNFLRGISDGYIDNFKDFQKEVCR